MKISFDFDSTLDRPDMQRLCKMFQKIGAEIFITTSRKSFYQNREIDNKEVFELAEKLNISKKNIKFTEGEDKFLFVENFDIHFDDDGEEIYLINEWPKGRCIGFLFEENYNRHGI